MHQFHFHFGSSASSSIPFPVQTSKESKSKSKKKSIKDVKRGRSRTPQKRTSKTLAIQDDKGVKKVEQKKVVVESRSPRRKQVKKRRRSQSSSSQRSSRSEGSSSSERFVQAASARMPGVQTGWQTSPSQLNPYASFTPLTAPPSQFIGPQLGNQFHKIRAQLSTPLSTQLRHYPSIWHNV